MRTKVVHATVENAPDMKILPSRRAVRRVFAAAMLALVAACATPRPSGCAASPGCDFPLGKASGFVLGQTTYEQVTASFGAPAAEETVTIDRDMAGRDLAIPVVARVLVYRYVAAQAQGAAPATRASRRAVLYFNGNRLLGYSTSSSFAADSTAFPLDTAPQLQKGSTTESDVLRLLGPPGGRAVYPLAVLPEGRTLFYDHVLLDTPPGSTTARDMTVHLTPGGVVHDFAATSKVTASQGTGRPAP